MPNRQSSPKTPLKSEPTDNSKAKKPKVTPEQTSSSNSATSHTPTINSVFKQDEIKELSNNWIKTPCLVFKKGHSLIILKEIQLFACLKTLVDKVDTGEEKKYFITVKRLRKVDWIKEGQNLVFDIENVLKKDTDDEDFKTFKVLDLDYDGESDDNWDNVKGVKHPILKKRLACFKDLIFEQIDPVSHADELIEKLEEKEFFKVALDFSQRHIELSFQTEADLTQIRMIPLRGIFPYRTHLFYADRMFEGFNTRPDYAASRGNVVGETKLTNCLRASNFKDLWNAVYLPRSTNENGVAFVHDAEEAFIFWHDNSDVVKLAHFDFTTAEGTKQFFLNLLVYAQKYLEMEEEKKNNPLEEKWIISNFVEDLKPTVLFPQQEH